MDPTSLAHNNISMRFEPIRAQDQDTEAQQTCNNNEDNGCSRRRRCHRVSQPSPSMKRTKMNDVNFDPAVKSHQGRKFRRRVTCDDTDTSPFAMGQKNVAQPTPSPIPSLSPEPQPQHQHQVALETDVALILAGLNSHLQQEDQAASDITPSLTSANHMKPCGNVNIDSIEVCQEGSYEDALQKLADSMKRTEWSRQQIMKQRAIIGATVSPQYLQPCHTVESVNQRSAANPDISIECLSKLVSNRRFCAVNAFFSGSRVTLTNGLDHSRRQLKMHTDEMRNIHTL